MFRTFFSERWQTSLFQIGLSSGPRRPVTVVSITRQRSDKQNSVGPMMTTIMQVADENGDLCPRLARRVSVAFAEEACHVECSHSVYTTAQHVSLTSPEGSLTIPSTGQNRYDTDVDEGKGRAYVFML